eukprot:1994123-Amphidinium_carterae.1
MLHFMCGVTCREVTFNWGDFSLRFKRLSTGRAAANTPFSCWAMPIHTHTHTRTILCWQHAAVCSQEICLCINRGHSYTKRHSWPQRTRSHAKATRSAAGVYQKWAQGAGPERVHHKQHNISEVTFKVERLLEWHAAKSAQIVTT